MVKKSTTIQIPDNIEKAKRLSVYAVLTRYPSWNNISMEKYEKAVSLAENVYNWVKEIIEEI